MIEGRIAEHGSHQELMEENAWYATILTMQLDEVDATAGSR